MLHVRIRRQPTSYTAKLVAVTLLLLVLGVGLIGGPGMERAQAQNESFPLASEVATTRSVELRSQPMTDLGEVLLTMPVNARAVILGGPFNEGWWWLEYQGTRGFVEGRYLVRVDANYTPVPEKTPTPETPTPQAPATDGTTNKATPPQSSTDGATTTFSTGPGNYAGLWLGELTHAGNVRSGPSAEARTIKSWWVGRRVLLYEGVADGKGEVWYRVSEQPEQPMYVHSSLVRRVAPVQFESVRWSGRWVNINLAQQIVTAYDGNTPVRVTLTSTGTRKHPTETGVWKIFYRLPKQDMEGGSRADGSYYYLKNVPYPQYFHRSGEGLHGTYWHDNFGRPMSHGCVNLSTPVAGWLYGWANVGTIVWVHY